MVELVNTVGSLNRARQTAGRCVSPHDDGLVPQSGGNPLPAWMYEAALSEEGRAEVMGDQGKVNWREFLG